MHIRRHTRNPGYGTGGFSIPTIREKKRVSSFSLIQHNNRENSMLDLRASSQNQYEHFIFFSSFNSCIAHCVCVCVYTHVHTHPHTRIYAHHLHMQCPWRDESRCQPLLLVWVLKLLLKRTVGVTGSIVDQMERSHLAWGGGGGENSLLGCHCFCILPLSLSQGAFCKDTLRLNEWMSRFCSFSNQVEAGGLMRQTQ